MTADIGALEAIRPLADELLGRASLALRQLFGT
jgi:hypothetical protein